MHAPGHTSLEAEACVGGSGTCSDRPRMLLMREGASDCSGSTHESDWTCASYVTGL
jgi:hypothetical protein